MKWILGSGPHSNWLGINEVNKRRRFAEVLKPESVVYDIGANVGSYTMLAAAIVGSHGSVVAIEPSPANLVYLNRHIQLNRLRNVDVLACALADHVGEIRFQETADRVTSHLSERGNVTVECTTIDALIASRRTKPPNCLKIDVEGAELKVLLGARRLLAEVRPLIFLATHGDKVRDTCLSVLDDAGYGADLIPGFSDEYLAIPKGGGRLPGRQVFSSSR